MRIHRKYIPCRRIVTIRIVTILHYNTIHYNSVMSCYLFDVVAVQGGGWAYMAPSPALIGLMAIIGIRIISLHCTFLYITKINIMNINII